MPSVVCEIASAADLDALVARQKSPVALSAYTVILRQVEQGPSWVARDASGLPVAIGGVLSADGWADEAWLLASPEAGRRLVPLVRAMLRVLSERAARTETGIVARVRVGNEAGERLAAALGFQASGLAHAVAPGAQIWMLKGETVWQP